MGVGERDERALSLKKRRNFRQEILFKMSFLRIEMRRTKLEVSAGKRGSITPWVGPMANFQTRAGMGSMKSTHVP